MAQHIVKWIMHISISFYKKSLVAAGLLEKLLPLYSLKNVECSCTVILENNAYSF